VPKQNRWSLWKNKRNTWLNFLSFTKRQTILLYSVKMMSVFGVFIIQKTTIYAQHYKMALKSCQFNRWPLNDSD
jgi:hypothetical protein